MFVRHNFLNKNSANIERPHNPLNRTLVQASMLFSLLIVETVRSSKLIINYLGKRVKAINLQKSLLAPFIIIIIIFVRLLPV